MITTPTLNSQSHNNIISSNVSVVSSTDAVFDDESAFDTQEDRDQRLLENEVNYRSKKQEYLEVAKEEREKEREQTNRRIKHNELVTDDNCHDDEEDDDDENSNLNPNDRSRASLGQLSVLTKKTI